MKSDVDAPVLNLFYSVKIGSAVCRQSFFHAEGNRGRNFSTSKPLNPAFEALLLVSIMPRLNYFLRKINSIKVSFG